MDGSRVNPWGKCILKFTVLHVYKSVLVAKCFLKLLCISFAFSGLALFHRNFYNLKQSHAKLQHSQKTNKWDLFCVLVRNIHNLSNTSFCRNFWFTNFRKSQEHISFAYNKNGTLFEGEIWNLTLKPVLNSPREK